jgi:hypothetical protein
MQNTPTGCGSHLPTILRTFKNHSKSRSVNISFKCSDLDPHSRNNIFKRFAQSAGPLQTVVVVVVVVGVAVVVDVTFFFVHGCHIFLRFV